MVVSSFDCTAYVPLTRSSPPATGTCTVKATTGVVAPGASTSEMVSALSGADPSTVRTNSAVVRPASAPGTDASGLPSASATTPPANPKAVTTLSSTVAGSAPGAPSPRAASASSCRRTVV